MSGLTQLCEEVKNGNKEKILKLLQENVDLKIIAGSEILLHLAIENVKSSEADLIEVLEAFLHHGIDINAKNEQGKTILHLAGELKMKDVIDLCIRQNGDLNASDKDGNTIAHCVIINEFEKTSSNEDSSKESIENRELIETENSNFVYWLILKGVDFYYKRNNKNFTALYLANDYNLQHILLMLLKHIPNFPSVEKYQKTLLVAFLERNTRSPSFKLYTTFPIAYFRNYESRYLYDIVEIILEKNTSISDITLALALRIAIKSHQDTKLIQMLLQHISHADNDENFGISLLEILANTFSNRNTKLPLEDKIIILRTLLLKNANLNKRTENGQTIAQLLFCRHPKIEILKVLKEVGTDFNIRTDHGETFLHLIASFGQEPGMVELAMDDRSDVNAVNSSDETPLQLAATKHNFFVMIDLIEHRANVNIIYTNGLSPLSMICNSTPLNFGAYLKYKVNNHKTLSNVEVNRQTSAPFLAVRVFDLLIENGANVNTKDQLGKRPLHYARNPVIIKILFKSGAYVDALDNKGYSPLYEPLLHGRFCKVQELLKCGADIKDPEMIELIKRVMTISGYDKYYDEFKRYFIKMEIVGLCENIEGFEVKMAKGAARKLIPECLTEVKKLKTFFIDDNTSLYDFLHTNLDNRFIYFNNEKLRNLMGDSVFQQEFPNYFVFILACYNEIVTRKRLFELAAYVLNKFTEIPLPILCTDQIFRQLSNKELFLFVDTFENVNPDELSESFTKTQL